MTMLALPKRGRPQSRATCLHHCADRRTPGLTRYNVDAGHGSDALAARDVSHAGAGDRNTGGVLRLPRSIDLHGTSSRRSLVEVSARKACPPWLTGDYEFVNHSAYNVDRGTVSATAVQLHGDF